MKYWVIGFFVLQIGFDLAHSVTAFPIVHYGMFSQSFARPDTLTVFRVSVDGVVLQASGFRVYSWDMVQEPLEAAEKRSVTNDFAFDKERMGAFYNKLKPNFDNTGDFGPWYKGYLERLLGRRIGVLRVERVRYRWSGGRMALIQTENWINA